MPYFDLEGARKAGYSDTEIADYLASTHPKGFDAQGARKAGYSDTEISNYLAAPTDRVPVEGMLRSIYGGATKGLGSIVGGLGELSAQEERHPWIAAMMGNPMRDNSSMFGIPILLRSGRMPTQCQRSCRTFKRSRCR